uniref:DUF7027 domain-containing protein n=1 Tax=Plectus sambesii TaxID=2011161 RepID=A0A914UHT0_9BILA
MAKSTNIFCSLLQNERLEVDYNWNVTKIWPKVKFSTERSEAAMTERMFGLHVKTWTWLIALIELVLAVIGLAIAIANLAEEHHRASAAFIIQVVVQIIWILVTFLLILALVTNRARYIYPHLLASIVVVIFFVVQFIIFLFNHISFGVFLYNALLVAIVMCCVVIEYRCYTWMMDYTDLAQNF